MNFTTLKSILAFQCDKCASMFGIQGDLSKMKCPICGGSSQFISDGFLAYNQVIKLESLSNQESKRSEEFSELPYLLSAKHISEIIGIGLKYAYELMDEKDFPLIPLGRYKKVQREDFFTWLKERRRI
ncbi:helix-turn-helix domain-containing protein [Metabacillus sp. FJAT-52054]|uniref:Helix-turn-helix domain-containing protein n=1 Tax=Metabacillus sediminis TaxID=3117746 RepID=A0ABZ2NMX1_9BACI